MAIAFNIHHLLVFRHDDCGVGSNSSEVVRVREALLFLSVDAQDLI